MAKLTVHLRFDGNCRQAFNFYKDVFEQEPILQTLGETPMASQFPPEMKDKIMHASLNKGNVILMGSDMIRDGKIQKCNNITIGLVCENKDEINILFKKLSKGGKVTNPLKDEFFGTYGDLTDKFGINWLFQFNESS